MRDDVLVAALPPTVLGFHALRPHWLASGIASQVIQAGGNATIADLGSVESLARLLTPVVLELSASAQHLSRMDFAALEAEDIYTGRCKAELFGLVEALEPATLVVVAQSGIAEAAARHIVQSFEESGLIGSGFLAVESVAQDGSSLADVYACIGSEWTSKLEGSAFELIQSATDPANRITDVYTNDVYPTLAQQTKALVFQVDVEGASEGEEVGIFRVLDEVGGIVREQGSRAFHVRFPESSRQVERVVSEFLHRHMNLRYGLDMPGQFVSKNFADRLLETNCASVSIALHTGSQRLAESRYGVELSVQQSELLVRRCAETGIHTALKLSYPCDEDDHHTREETLRLVRRAMPHAVQVVAGERSTVPSGRTPEERRARLRTEIASLGIATEVTAETALCASLAGYRGREAQFIRYVDHCFCSGEIEALGTLVERINEQARGRAPFTRLLPDQRVAGN